MAVTDLRELNTGNFVVRHQPGVFGEYQCISSNSKIGFPLPSTCWS